MQNIQCTMRYYVLLLLAMVVLCTEGCTVFTADRERAAKAMEQNMALQNEIDRLRDELERQNVANARLQMALVQQNEKRTPLSGSRQGPVKEVAGSTIRPPAASTRVETVAYLAEVTAEIESARAKSKPEDKDLFAKADELLAKSNQELEEERYEQATQSAAQALDLISRLQFSGGTETRISTEKYADFITPLVLKVARKSNVRKTPGMQGKVVTILASETHVNALGHKGRWIKIMLQDGRQGWIYYSLLSIPEHLKSLKRSSG